MVVTAGRRAEDVTKIPYNIAVVGGGQLERTGVSSVEDLSRQIPNLVVTSSGNRYLGAQRQIMRGLNASAADRRGVTIEQNAVSTYLDNSPYANFFPLRDIERVEVLRGPQGTLYGAGTLGGAIRLISRAPDLDSFGGSIEASGGVLAHSKDRNYSFQGFVNAPISETLAFRASASREHSAGFIDQIGAFVRPGVLGDPVLVDPVKFTTSPALTQTIKDANWDESTFWRASLKWRPAENFSATLAYNNSRSLGEGPSKDNPHYPGGSDPFSPRVTYPSTGQYEIVQRGLEPFKRRSQMGSLDLSYDAGFATLSSTSSYFKTRGDSYFDATLGTAALPAVYVVYYTGSPVNPRFNVAQDFSDRNEVFTQEVRLVSKGGGSLDYVVGAFYQKEKRTDLWTGYAPGQDAYDHAPGVTYPGGVGPDDRLFTVGGEQEFTDKALFGDLTWRATDRLDITVGARVFQQEIVRKAISDLPTFLIAETSVNKVEFSDHLFKLNASYGYASGHQVYATFSQGFRRGGANAFALSGYILEPRAILDYRPDKVDNFEVGLKGSFSNGWRYTLDAFVDQWRDPQIGGFTPYNVWPVTVNGKGARTRGLEAELSGQITSGLSFSAGYARTDAKLTKDFCIPVGVGDGVHIDQCGFRGIAGTQLPSAPRNSGTLTLNYHGSLSNGDGVGAGFNANYKGSMRQLLPQFNQRYPMLPAYWLASVNLSWDHGPLTTSLYVRNLFDKRTVYNRYARITPFEPLDLSETIGRPREIGFTLKHSW